MGRINPERTEASNVRRRVAFIDNSDPDNIFLIPWYQVEFDEPLGLMWEPHSITLNDTATVDVASRKDDRKVNDVRFVNADQLYNRRPTGGSDMSRGVVGGPGVGTSLKF